MKKVGIIGGLGPQTSAEFCLKVVFACSKITKVRPNILVSNVAIPLETESEIINGKNKEKVLPLLIDSAKQLEKAGANFIVIPCNTVHVFIDKIRKSVNIPILSIIDETISFLVTKRVKRVGLLGTPITVKEKLFDKKLKENKIKMVTPNKSDQLELGRVIDCLVKNSHGEKDRFLRVVNKLAAKDVDCILLACTDLQLLIKSHDKVRIFDTLEILERATVRKIIGKSPSLL